MSTENLTHADAIKKIKELSENAKICMFCTELDKAPINSRPMSLQETDEEGNLWFISSDTSNKNFEIKEDKKVQLFFMNNGDYQYLSVYGDATVYKDKATIDDKWSEKANAWFDGKDDPTVSIIRVEPKESYYWDTKAGKLVSILTFVAAAITGKKADNSDGVEGNATV
ncbi:MULTISPECIES: pyridoxamine 5'-phosphate oxidase family protein [Chryseobacterium]|uniref:General stress protein 26 n=1 Tax=Chryseobacterium camelliae TaxID=1265445 RepID=A0ABU0TGT5_9FLAO|nr:MULTISPECIES: pyridoxamine 5'-phosphate oxidase family protein [Chryseobacterium]MDT3405939.1 general stress protein 26 [Pseudacidovorax intermedius]MDQ1096257.1 general stress protein 26 [Chryseobacterium camelliae]MDQ1100194.1 general stress protein 26 [Chryseobacterium sp. SORGH_AS_1048]MDR6087539.1 general stress protein 26 [Chryseobacterium sp. SORGH_AS_0909]MDR6131913.1 general stress protein 26 [Chryseobacterium sp. SORGH_AS_1175]